MEEVIWILFTTIGIIGCFIIAIKDISLDIEFIWNKHKKPVPPVYETVGIDYCLIHYGTRNEDDNQYDEEGKHLVCDWFETSDKREPCKLVPLGFLND